MHVAVCPPFPYLISVAETLRGSPVALGGQNLYPEKEGAFTGEVSPAMLLDVGCRYVILGHSERRQKLDESDAFINRKVHAALAAGLSAILCIGETLEERQTDKMQAILTRQVSGSLTGVTAEAAGPLTVIDTIDHDAESRVRYHYTLVAVIGHWQSGEGVPGDDADEVAWLTRAEIIEHGFPTAPALLPLFDLALRRA